MNESGEGCRKQKKTSVFIDGSHGTTGLRIEKRLSGRDDIRLIKLEETLRHYEKARADAMNQSRIVFLCLPDAEAERACRFVTNPETVIIDTSTAHRTDPGWVYGLPELKGQAEKIRTARRIANPGCHATGMIVLTAPLVESGLLPGDTLLKVVSLTGYSGGGKKMIAQYESASAPMAARLYALGQNHKHLPEMKQMAHLTKEPVFMPIIGQFYAGMETIIPLGKDEIKASPGQILQVYRDYYAACPLIHVQESLDEQGYLIADTFSGRDDLAIGVYGSDERILLTALFDNLGKGASGSAIENMNLVLGQSEDYGLMRGDL